MKYSKINNEQIKSVDVFLGTDIDWAVSQGFTEMEVEQAYDGAWYLAGFAPVAAVPTLTEQNEIIRARRESLYDELTDPLTARKMRKIALNDWNEADETAYVADLVRLTGQIDNDNPYVVVDMITPAENIVDESAEVPADESANSTHSTEGNDLPEHNVNTGVQSDSKQVSDEGNRRINNVS